MIYHICPHFDSFIKTAIDRFELIKPGFNRCIELYDEIPGVTNMKIRESEEYVFISCSYKDAEWGNALLSDCTGIIIHHLMDYMLDPILSLPEHIKIYFRSYGGDIFDLIYDADKNFYFPGTERILKRNFPVKYVFQPAMNKVYCTLIPHKRHWETTKEKKVSLLRRLFAIGTSCPYEYDIILNSLPELRLKYLRLGYFPLTDVESPKGNSAKVNIVVGHSNSPGQNHLDAFELLSKYNINGEIIAPLTYVDSKYTKAVIKEGYRILKSKFRPLIEFMPKDDYFQILSSAYAFIELSIFQQGLGNIMYMLKQGSNVYLPKENPFYIYCRNVGITIFSVEDDLCEEHLINHRLNQSEISLNNKLLNEFYSSDVDNDTAKIIINNFK